MKPYNHSSTLRLAALLASIILSGCMESTSTQRNYSDARDTCQEAASLKVGAFNASSGADEKEHQTNLVAEFKDCMRKTGWTVTGPDRDKTEKASVTAGVAPVAVAPLAPPVDTRRIKRAEECAYAKQAANHSSNARAIAKACELECRNMRSLSPDAPAPAACTP